MQGVIDLIFDCFSQLRVILFEKFTFTLYGVNVSLGHFMFAVIIMGVLFTVFLTTAGGVMPGADNRLTSERIARERAERQSMYNARTLAYMERTQFYKERSRKK